MWKSSIKLYKSEYSKIFSYFKYSIPITNKVAYTLKSIRISDIFFKFLTNNLILKNHKYPKSITICLLVEKTMYQGNFFIRLISVLNFNGWIFRYAELQNKKIVKYYLQNKCMHLDGFFRTQLISALNTTQSYNSFI